jgi:hypothetical protein
MFYNDGRMPETKNQPWVLDDTADLKSTTPDFRTAMTMVAELQNLGLPVGMETNTSEDEKTYSVYVYLNDIPSEGDSDDDLVELTDLGEAELEVAPGGPVAEPDGRPNYMGDTGIGRVREAYEATTPDPGARVAQAITGQVPSFRETMKKVMDQLQRDAMAKRPISAPTFEQKSPPNAVQGGGGAGFATFARLQNESSRGKEPAYAARPNGYSSREEREAYARARGRVPKNSDGGLCLNVDCNYCYKDARRLRPGMADAAKYAGCDRDPERACNYCYEDNA